MLIVPARSTTFASSANSPLLPAALPPRAVYRGDVLIIVVVGHGAKHMARPIAIVPSSRVAHRLRTIVSNEAARAVDALDAPLWAGRRRSGAAGAMSTAAGRHRGAPTAAGADSGRERPPWPQTHEHDENRKGAFMEDNDATEVDR